MEASPQGNRFCVIDVEVGIAGVSGVRLRQAITYKFTKITGAIAAYYVRFTTVAVLGLTFQGLSLKNRDWHLRV